MKDRASWCFISGLVSAREERLLAASAFRELVAMQEPAQIAGRIRQTTLFADLPTDGGAMTLAKEMDRRYSDHVRRIIEEGPPNAMLRFFLLADDWHKFKEYAKSDVGADSSKRSAGEAEAQHQFGISRWARVWSGLDVAPEDVPFREAAEAIQSLAAGAEAVLTMVDGVCDGRMLAQMEDIARSAEDEDVGRAIAGWVEVNRAIAILRTRRQGVDVQMYREWFGRWFSERLWCDALYTAPAQQWTPIVREGLYEYTGELPIDLEKDDAASLVRLEMEAMNRLTERIHPARWVTFGPERVFAYLWELMVEAFNLKVALCGTAGRLAPQELSERLRYTYV